MEHLGSLLLAVLNLKPRRKVSVKVEAESADGLNEMRFNMSSWLNCELPAASGGYSHCAHCCAFTASRMSTPLQKMMKAVFKAYAGLVLRHVVIWQSLAIPSPELLQTACSGFLVGRLTACCRRQRRPGATTTRFRWRMPSS